MVVVILKLLAEMLIEGQAAPLLVEAELVAALLVSRRSCVEYHMQMQVLCLGIVENNDK